jgi:hypothetical protein
VVLRREPEGLLEEAGALPGAAQPQVLVLAPQQDQLRVVVSPEALPSRTLRVQAPGGEHPSEDLFSPPQPRPVPKEHPPAGQEPRRDRYSRREGAGPRGAEQGHGEEHQRPHHAHYREAELRRSMPDAARTRVQAPQLVPQREGLFVGCAP